MSKPILITGCSGFLAPYLVEALTKDFDPIPTLHGLTEVTDFQSNQMEVCHVDLTDREAVIRTVEKIKPGIIFHLAAIANVGFSWKHPKETYDVNFIGSSNLLEAIILHAPKCRLIVMSTAELYGSTKTTPHSETDPLGTPRNPYALSKMAMEMMIDLYNDAKELDLDLIKIRSFNFTGPGQNRKFVASDFSAQIAEIEKGIRPPVMAVGNLAAIRDISDVRDSARYLSTLAKKGRKGATYNLCSGNQYSIQELLDTLLSLSSAKIKVTVDKDKLRPIDVPVLAGDNSLIKEEFKLVPKYNFKQTLKDILNYWRQRVD